MGARGNSGVILSQLFRGLAKSIAEHGEVNAQQVAAGLQNGVDTAYKAVVKPVEGTILTVAREAAKHATVVARRNIDVLELMVEVLNKAKEALARTPDQLPVLKQVGVVDAGGQGLVCIYEGFVASLKGADSSRELPLTAETSAAGAAAGSAHSSTVYSLHNQAVHMPTGSAQAQLSTDDIEFGYCTEFMIQLIEGKSADWVFDELGFRAELEKHGDSVLVVADDDLVKVHLHAELPGDVLTLAQRYGDLIKIKIENMREQHTHLLVEDAAVEAGSRSRQESSDRTGASAGGGMNASIASVPNKTTANHADTSTPYGFVAVSMGGGIAAILESLGADVVLSGGQTMNPSTEDIVKAVQHISARTVFVLPNNSNIIMAAQQAKELVDKEVIVIPSKTIPQGMSALLAFQDKLDTAKNTEAMLKAISGVQSGQVTYAVRDSQIDGLDIKEGDYLGIHNSKIVTSTPSLQQTCQALLASMTSEGGEIITILAGEDASEHTTSELVDWLDQEYPNAEVEVHHGGQPLYYYIMAVE
jgi:DAK2 domain fusion protein YloV